MHRKRLAKVSQDPLNIVIRSLVNCLVADGLLDFPHSCRLFLSVLRQEGRGENGLPDGPVVVRRKHSQRRALATIGKLASVTVIVITNINQYLAFHCSHELICRYCIRM